MRLFQQTKQSLPSNILQTRFGWPPFSMLDTTSAEWMKRVRLWKTVIQDSGAGRDVGRYNATPINIFSTTGADKREANPISIFDPFLCELMYRWFSTEGATILDPFAGGSVRGLVAAALGKHYTGLDLSSEQVDENRRQYQEVNNKFNGIEGDAEWICGDSDYLLNSLPHKYDMILTCPPYYNLEQYTKNPLDLSRLPTYSDFLHKYSSILYKAVQHLAENSFMVIVVSEVRREAKSASSCEYYGLVPDTIHILRDECHLNYYNEIILLNSMGSLPIRTPRSFSKTRKIGRRHQNVLVFYKGDVANIESKFGCVEV